MYKIFFKVFFDKLIALIALILLIPVFLIIILSSKFYQGGSVFFLQNRPGKDEQVFQLIKFKTMTDNKDNQGNLLPDKDRLTTYGLFLRHSSLDEIPQLINVLKGDMSLIGPRPLMVRYLPLYSEEQAKRHLIKPGVTGWAQVNGRNSISWEDKFKLDVWYVNNVSLLLDIKIVFLTLKKVITRDSISSSTSVTMEPFKGNDK